MAPMGKPDWKGPAYVSRMIVGDIVLALLVRYSSGAGMGTGLTFLLIGAFRVAQAVSKDTVHWRKGQDEMPYGRVAILALALVWICLAVVLIARPEPVTVTATPPSRL